MLKKSHYIIFLLITIFSCKINAQYKIQFSNNYPPYNYLNENEELVGFNVDILIAIANLYKTDLDITTGEWKTINKTLDNNSIDAIGGVNFPGSLDPNYIYTRATINTSHCFFYNKYHINTFSLEYLRTSKEPLVAMWKNDVLIHYIQSINPAVKFLFINNYEDLINAIDKPEVTCVFGQRIGGMYYADKLNKDYVTPFDHRILERSMGFKVSKDEPELANILNNGLEIILANGKYQEIYDKWMGKYENTNNLHNYLNYLLIAGIIIISLLLLLVVINSFLKTKIKNKTKDLRDQLTLNSKIMKELEKEKNKAEESDKMKSAFLANMSHEIRTPMNGILGFTNLLKTVNYSSEKQAQFIDIIQKSGNRMLETINNIIDVSKLESGLEKTTITNVNIQETIHELYNFFTLEAAAKGVNLYFNEEKTTLTAPFYSDAYKVNAILTNLIKNALKFTHKGTVSLSYNLSNTEFEFWVKDTGIGIPKDKQSTIFNEFVQANYSHSSGYEGSGLGLSISKGYVHLLQGKITLQSEPGEGATFYVRIPNASIHLKNTTTVETSKKITSASFTNLNILIAEDDDTSYFYLEQALQNITVKILRARDGKEAVELTKNNTDIDIILMDIKMPNLNGFEATRKIRKFNKNIPIIGQTAYIQDSFKTNAASAGFDAYISKPINIDELNKQINKLIAKN